MSAAIGKLLTQFDANSRTKPAEKPKVTAAPARPAEIKRETVAAPKAETQPDLPDEAYWRGYADGTRRATVLVPAGTTAGLMQPDGTTRPASTLNVRLTEYTVGSNGPQAMPAELPPTSISSPPSPSIPAPPSISAAPSTPSPMASITPTSSTIPPPASTSAAAEPKTSPASMAAAALPSDFHRQLHDRGGDLRQCLNPLCPEFRFGHRGLSRFGFERCHGSSGAVRTVCVLAGAALVQSPVVRA